MPPVQCPCARVDDRVCCWFVVWCLHVDCLLFCNFNQKFSDISFLTSVQKCCTHLLHVCSDHHDCALYTTRHSVYEFRCATIITLWGQNILCSLLWVIVSFLGTVAHPGFTDLVSPLLKPCAQQMKCATCWPTASTSTLSAELLQSCRRFETSSFNPEDRSKCSLLPSCTMATELLTESCWWKEIFLLTCCWCWWWCLMCQQPAADLKHTLSGINWCLRSHGFIIDSWDKGKRSAVFRDLDQHLMWILEIVSFRILFYKLH